MKLGDRVAVISGAGSGIGRALAHELARRGCHLALADIDEAGLDRTAAELAEGSEPTSAPRATGGAGAPGPTALRISRHRLDVASRDAVDALPPAVLAAHGRVDLLVNNAGVALGGYFEQVSEADFDWLMEINFHGLVRMTRAFLPHLRASDDARIVNLSSVYGLISPPGQTAYSASKFAVRGFSNALRHELAATNVGVTVVHPGGVATAIARRARIAAGVPPDEVQAHMARAEKLLRLPPERAAAIIVRAVEQRRARVLVGTDAKVIAWLERLAPVHYWRLLARAVGL
jgi:NAD(P)-dependent dehydrogenase (short-subunit alcohol dehydrogenase family)